eukprot:TRINITY_DN9388_c0_g1_i1.p1 TRINITY_DN9388_c0_g1~~TRINITY_DN9388_c0_g1_i1.p1  ORF type:complete len:332 (+),score=83.04 TRINITY_DN9388_c0_g1_i1:196-1191(+)
MKDEIAKLKKEQHMAKVEAVLKELQQELHKEGRQQSNEEEDSGQVAKEKDPFQDIDSSTEATEETFLALKTYDQPAAKWGAEHPEFVADLLKKFTAEDQDLRKLQTPIHRVLDYIMVRDCEIKKGGKRGCIDGFVLPEQAEKYYDWTTEWAAPDSPTLCETGFNAGHSAVTFLLAKPGLKMNSFDLFIQAYSSSCYDYIRAVFGEARMTVHKGDSHKSLGKLGKVPPDSRLHCDAVSVDGAHSFKACLKDVEGLGNLIFKEHTPVLMDDTADGFEMNGGPAEVWRKLKKENRLIQTRCVPLGVVQQWKRGSKAKPRGFCIGELNPGLGAFE